MRLLALLATVGLAIPGAAQGKADKRKVDPYTKGDAKAMAQAGYLSFGPFAFGNLADKPVTSTDIDDTLPYIQIHWIETPHFRIGVELPEWVVPQDATTKGKVRKELEAMQAKLPTINPKAKTIDPWLRTHMVAHRVETLYAETQQLFGVTDADFPSHPSMVVTGSGARYMGFGPYLGMKDKYLVLVFERGSSYQTYAKKFIGRDTRMPQRWHFPESSSILISFATESEQFPLKHDTALHCALAFNVSHNLLDGFRYYAYDLPVWIREGWGHWNCRRVDPKWPNFDQNEGSLADMRLIEKWGVYTRQLLASPDKIAPFPEAATWRDFGNIKFNDHVAVWSRIDWLLSQGPEKWQKFLFAVKGRVDANYKADQTDLVGAVRQALQDAYGVSMLDFDRRWAEWAKATYPAQ